MLRRCCLRQLCLLPRRTVRWQSTANPPKSSISKTLLRRASAATDERARLSEKISEAFNTETAKRIGELTPISEALQRWNKANESLQELQALISDASADKELRALAVDDLEPTRFDLSEASAQLTASLIPPHPFAELGCLVEIRPGAGGEEAAIFAGDLLRMYQAFCARTGLAVSMLKHETTGDASDHNAPLQEAILEINTPGAYGTLRCEAGVHRVQRVPATESKGRTHTSAVSVMVLPSFPESGAPSVDMTDPKSDYYVNPTEVRTDVLRASGAGGQHVNRTESAVRLVHEPTNTVVSMQDFRSQHKNREKAWQILRARLAQQKREAREDEAMRLRRGVVGVGRMGRGDKIRTYNWSQQRVTDHRSGLSVHDLDDVVEGGDLLGKVMDSVRSWMQDTEVEALVAEDEHG